MERNALNEGGDNWHFAIFNERNSERERELELALPSRFSVLLTLQVSERGFSLDKTFFFFFVTFPQFKYDPI